LDATFRTTPDIAISPDGTSIVYVGRVGSTPITELFLRRLDRLEPTPFTTDGGRSPFFSPDGRWIGYFTGVGLHKVSIAGGLPVTLARNLGFPRGATWTPDNTIIFGTDDRATGLLQVSADGGEPKPLTTPGRDELDHLWPQILPGGAAVLFTIRQRGPLEGAARVALLDLRTGEQKVLLPGGSDARYIPPGTLIYAASGTLQAVGFSVHDFAVSGPTVPVLEQLWTDPNGGMNLTLSGDGTLIYAARAGAGLRSLVWADRRGRETPLELEPRAFGFPRLSGDGTRLAVHVEDPTNTDIVLYDQRRATQMRLTFDRAQDIRPLWTPDDKWILFRSDDEIDGPGVYRKSSDGSGAPERIVSLNSDGGPNSVTPDGKTLIYTRVDAPTNRDLWMVSLEGDRTPRPLVVEPGSQGNAVVSPDGRWIAYDHDDSIYVRPFPNVAAGGWQVSPPGTKWPVWSRDGRALFYASGQSLMSIPVQPTAQTFQWGAGSKVLEGSYADFSVRGFPRNYDVSPDGQRFLVLKDDTADESPNVIVVENWVEELKRLVPTN
jgi:serine/threonine-protein kinase